jgi:hypothetical protein
MDLKEIRSETDSTGSTQGSMADSCVLSGFIKAGNLLIS